MQENDVVGFCEDMDRFQHFERSGGGGMQEAVLNRVYHQVVDYLSAMTEHFLYQPSLVRNTSKLH